LKFSVVHITGCRIRITFDFKHSEDFYDQVTEHLRSCENVTGISVYERIGGLAVKFYGGTAASQNIITLLRRFEYNSDPHIAETSIWRINRQFRERLITLLLREGFRRLFLPAYIRSALTVIRSVKYLKLGLRSILDRQLRTELLDAVSILVSLLRAEFSTASTVMLLLRTGELLDEWTHKKSVQNLAETMALNVESVWRVTGGTDELVPIAGIKAGDRLRIRPGGVIPLDGIIIEGDVLINQASMTGEGIPINKRAGTSIFAGTIVEEGDCLIEVTASKGLSRYDRIVNMIETNDKLKSSVEKRAASLADKLVPYILFGSAAVFALTRNTTRAASVLMVDFSCALKLTIPIAILSCMGQAGKMGISVKGGKFLEMCAEADSIVFDKTGTLTEALPSVARVITFGGINENECLRLAACLEEHYPHSIANAVVRAAQERDLKHEEEHAQIKYIVAHGISSEINGNTVHIGSRHFVFEDENCRIPEYELDKWNSLPDEYSHLFLAISGTLVAVICIDDPLKSEAANVINRLHSLGIARIVMLTGDNERTASRIAGMLGLDYFKSELLPDEKSSFIESERQAGHTVIMIGDGINDSPALSAASVGIAVGGAAPIALTIADITIVGDLARLPVLITLARALMKRIRQHYNFVLAFNGSLIVLGAMGLLTPTASALLHNASTIAVSLKSTTDINLTM